MIIQVDFGAAQTGVGYRFYDSSGAYVGSRVTSGIVAGPATGTYVADATVPGGAVGVYWDCTGDATVFASEELGGRLKIETNLDATVSSRNATAPDNASIGTILTRTDVATSTRASATDYTTARAAKLDNLDALVSSRSSHSAADVWAVGTRTLTGFGTLVADIATTVWAAASRTLTAFGFSSPDPWAVALPGSYADGTAGKLVSKLNVGTPSAPVLPIPAPPTDLSLCTVYGYLEDAGNAPAADVKITFQLQKPATGAKSERLIFGDTKVAVTDASGFFSLQLQRNDLLTPSGSTWKVTCGALWKTPQTITLNGDLFDLKTVVS